MSLGLRSELAAGTLLARSLCGVFIGVFWFARLMIQLFLFNPKPYLTTRLLAVGYHGLTVVFIYLAVVYLAAAVRHMRFDSAEGQRPQLHLVKPG